MKAFLLTLLLIVTACYPPPLPKCSVKNADPTCTACVPEIFETFVVDERFTEYERNAIANGAAMWNVATQGQIEFKLNIGSTIDYDGPRIVNAPGQLPDSLVGMTRKPLIELDTIQLNHDYMEGIAAHEFGHYLGLS
jgi:hypothetical protein